MGGSVARLRISKLLLMMSSCSLSETGRCFGEGKKTMDPVTGEMARWVQVPSVVRGPELGSWNSCKCLVGYLQP